jgi:hypothetical protein
MWNIKIPSGNLRGIGFFALLASEMAGIKLAANTPP